MSVGTHDRRPTGGSQHFHVDGQNNLSDIRGGRMDLETKWVVGIIDPRPPEDAASGCTMLVHLLIQRISADGAPTKVHNGAYRGWSCS